MNVINGGIYEPREEESIDRDCSLTKYLKNFSTAKSMKFCMIETSGNCSLDESNEILESTSQQMSLLTFASTLIVEYSIYKNSLNITSVYATSYAIRGNAHDEK